jgi:hypothetical protein
MSRHMSGILARMSKRCVWFAERLRHQGTRERHAGDEVLLLGDVVSAWAANRIDYWLPGDAVLVLNGAEVEDGDDADGRGLQLEQRLRLVDHLDHLPHQQDDTANHHHGANGPASYPQTASA